MYLKKLVELPSSVSWCESPKYAHSEYIAEFWNTLTGISLLISAIICFNKNMERGIHELYISNFLLGLVGIGTILFHGTLLYVWQLLDEIPMLLIVIEYHKLLTTKTFMIRKKLDLHIGLMYDSLPLIFFSYFIKKELHVIMFQNILAICITLLLIKITIKTYYKSIQYNKGDVNIGICLFIFSMIIWNIDNHYCNQIPKFIQLHAIWHITTSFGMYYCNNIMITLVEFEKREVNFQVCF